MTIRGHACLSIVMMSLVIRPAQADLVESDIFLAGEHYSEWQYDGSQAKCELRHEIPQFGISRFLRIAGQDLTFRINSFQPTPRVVEGLIRETTPSWKDKQSDPITLPVILKQGLLPVDLRRKEAAWLLASLADGQMPGFDFLDWDDTRKKVHVRLSPVNFQKAYRQFKLCLNQMSNKGFDDYRETEVNFELDKHVLRSKEQATLEELADYILADRSIKRIMIDGHADDQGTHPYNRKLSQRRADSVEAFLTKAGVSAGQIETHAYGETKLKINSRTESAREANRRAEIRLIRD